MNIILWVLSLKRQSTLQALSTPISRFQELLTSLRRALTCLHCHLRNFFRFLEQNKDDKACVTHLVIHSPQLTGLTAQVWNLYSHVSFFRLSPGSSSVSSDKYSVKWEQSRPRIPSRIHPAPFHIQFREQTSVQGSLISLSASLCSSLAWSSPSKVSALPRDWHITQTHGHTGREEAAAAAAGVAQDSEQLTFAERPVSGGSHRSGCWELLPPQRTAPCSLPGATQGRPIQVRFHFIRTNITAKNLFISKLFILRLIYVGTLSLIHHFCQWPQPHMSSAHLPGKLVLLAKSHILEEESRGSILGHLLCGTQTPWSLWYYLDLHRIFCLRFFRIQQLNGHDHLSFPLEKHDL